VRQFIGTVRPTLWVTIERIFQQLFLLLIFAIQAPLLGPHAFGSITVVMVLVGFWDAAPRFAASDALISIKKIDRLHYSAVTAIFLLLSVVFGGALYWFAEPFARLVGDATLVPVMRALAVLPVIQSLSLAPMAAAQREMQFKSITIRTIVSLLAGGLVGLVLAVAGLGVWALVWQALTQAIVAAVALWVVVPISFSLAFSARHFGDVARYGLPGLLGRLMNWTEGQAPRLILGVLAGPVDLGLFGLGARLNDMVTQVAIRPIALVARVDFRRFAEDHHALEQAIGQALLRMSLLAFPVCTGAAAIMPALFHVWLNPKWLGGLVPAQLLLLMVMPSVTFYVATATLLAVNRQRSEAGISTFTTASIVSVVAVFSHFGLAALTLALFVRAVVSLPVPIIVLRRTCRIGVRFLLLPQLPALVASCLMGLGVWTMRTRFNMDHGVAALLALIGAGAVIYALIVAAMLPRRLLEAGKQFFFEKKNQNTFAT
jgi:PST family polysaccharide transporter